MADSLGLNATTVTSFSGLGFATTGENSPAPAPGLTALLSAGGLDVAARGTVAASCIDRRQRSDGTDPFYPNVAGGFFGVLFAVRLVTPSYDPTWQHSADLARLLLAHHLPVVAHIDQDYPRNNKTGCSFNDLMNVVASHLPVILDDTLTLFASLGLTGVEPDCARMLADSAARLRAGHGGPGDDALRRLVAVRDSGAHVEIMGRAPAAIGADISFHAGHTLSRRALWESFAVGMYHLDPWSFATTATQVAQILPRSPAQIHANVTQADLARQLTTGLLLASFSALSLLCAPQCLLVLRV